MLRHYAAVLLLFIFLVSPSTLLAQQPAASPAPPTTAPTQQSGPAVDPNDPIVRIKDEAMNRSQVMQTLSYLSDVMPPGPRVRSARQALKARNNSKGVRTNDSAPSALNRFSIATGFLGRCPRLFHFAPLAL